MGSDAAKTSSKTYVSVLFNEPKLLKSRRLQMVEWCCCRVSVLFNEPKLLKCCQAGNSPEFPRNCFSALQRAEIAEMSTRRKGGLIQPPGFSALQRAEIAEMPAVEANPISKNWVSVLFNEPKLLKYRADHAVRRAAWVSVLFNEPKLLKSRARLSRFGCLRVSVLFNEPKLLKLFPPFSIKIEPKRFSALQRAEIAEIIRCAAHALKRSRFSALQRAEIAEILQRLSRRRPHAAFQCSSTSRNC